jgi:hypothetical protein
MDEEIGCMGTPRLSENRIVPGAGARRAISAPYGSFGRSALATAQDAPRASASPGRAPHS